MSEKPRVYQGVRVKTTVKELLKRHRAQEANSRKLQTAYLELKELYAPVFPSRHEDTSPAAPAASVCSGGSRAAPPRAASFPLPDGSCSLQMQVSAFNDVQQQYGDVMMPSNGYNNSNPKGDLSYNPPLHHGLTSSPLPWSHGLSSDADYYGHGMAACSSSESLTRNNLMDPNSYSPQDSFSSSSSSCYDSPTRMESSHHSFPSESYHYQHCSPYQDYVPGCWPGQQESLSAPEYTPYYNPTDYPYTCTVEESYFRKEFPLNSEMCYNVL
ncbi:colorectal cancer associated 2 [Kryptolebias marmoratus]|uniref:colorectal cancer associated 2 n=1 Tax=Kryptolebias marmoratus TaxID=37003 RepID=UPI000D52F331|nr:colorectal cancer associated 2 [Kryptolebias marmoratus]